MAIELTLHCQMCDLYFKFEEDRTKTAVTVESDKYFGQTDKHSSNFISVQCHALHWTDNEHVDKYVKYNRSQTAALMSPVTNKKQS